MPTEVERKFLIHPELLPPLDKGVRLVQGYVWNDPDKNLRVRIAGLKAFLTVKIGNSPLKRGEFEYEIPLKDAEELLNLCGSVIEKTRYLIKYGNHTWEVDVFEGENRGLVIAEVELQNENEKILLPGWVGREVSQDPRYLNAELAKKPFSRWKKKG